jgi:F-type H+-transporting ATPase subunit epsilon
MYHFFLATPEEIIFDEMIHSVIVPGGAGYFEVLQNHAPIISTLKPGKITLTDKDQKQWVWTVSGGLIEVIHNKATLLADSIFIFTPKTVTQ